MAFVDQYVAEFVGLAGLDTAGSFPMLEPACVD